MVTNSAQGLDPGAPLTLGEAALLVDVDVSVIEALARDGTLLTERQAQGKGTVTVVRLVDLGDIYPHVVGRHAEPTVPVSAGVTSEVSPGISTEVPRGAEPSKTERPGAEGSEPEPRLRDVEFRREGGETVVAFGDDSVGELVRTSDTSRDALIGLCQDLEERLDLAERERQASTASLLMAQRRVLDLELARRNRPWYTVASKVVAAAALIMVGMGALLALRLPGLVRAAAQEAVAAESAPLRQAARDEVKATAAAIGTDMRRSLGEVQAATRALEESFGATMAESLQAVRGDLETAQADALATLERRLQAAEDVAQERADALARAGTAADERARADREELERSLAASTALLAKARAALEAQRDERARDRTALLATLADLSAGLGRLEAAAAQDVPAAQPPESEERAWWVQLFGLRTVTDR